jgi:hypothetical protein
MRSVEDELADEYVRAALDGADPHATVPAETARQAAASLPKNRATRRAHGQRGAGPIRGGGAAFLANRKPNGLQRAALRAHAKGLRVGYPVRAQVMTKTRPGPQNPLVPLEFGERISNYRVQQAVRTHSIGGTRWRPTPRQRRRLDHKANHVAAPFKRPQPEPFAERVTSLTTGEQRTEPLATPVTPEAFAEPVVRATAVESGWHEVSGTVAFPATPPPRGPMIAQGSGFRVVDRRGEHR